MHMESRRNGYIMFETKLFNNINTLGIHCLKLNSSTTSIHLEYKPLVQKMNERYQLFKLNHIVLDSSRVLYEQSTRE